jgi:hypothetical protein
VSPDSLGPVRRGPGHGRRRSHHRRPGRGRAPACSLAAPPQPLKMRGALGTRTTVETRLLCHQPQQRTDYEVLVCSAGSGRSEVYLATESFDQHRLERTRESSVPVVARYKPPDSGSCCRLFIPLDAHDTRRYNARGSPPPPRRPDCGSGPARRRERNCLPRRSKSCAKKLVISPGAGRRLLGHIFPTL